MWMLYLVDRILLDRDPIWSSIGTNVKEDNNTICEPVSVTVIVK